MQQQRKARVESSYPNTLGDQRAYVVEYTTGAMLRIRPAKTHEAIYGQLGNVVQQVATSAQRFYNSTILGSKGVTL